MTTVWVVEIFTTEGINLSARSANDAGIELEFDISSIEESLAKYFESECSDWFVVRTRQKNNNFMIFLLSLK